MHTIVQCRASRRRENEYNMGESGRRVMRGDSNETGLDRVKALFNIRWVCYIIIRKTNPELGGCSCDWLCCRCCVFSERIVWKYSFLYKTCILLLVHMLHFIHVHQGTNYLLHVGIRIVLVWEGLSCKGHISSCRRWLDISPWSLKISFSPGS